MHFVIAYNNGKWSMTGTIVVNGVYVISKMWRKVYDVPKSDKWSMMGTKVVNGV